MMATRPTIPSTILGSFGPSTKVCSGAGRAISDLEPAGDLEGHETRRLVDGLTGEDDVDFLELPGGLEIGHEVGDRGRREGGTVELQDGLLLLEAGNPQVPRDRVDERVEQDDR